MGTSNGQPFSGRIEAIQLDEYGQSVNPFESISSGCLLSGRPNQIRYVLISRLLLLLLRVGFRKALSCLWILF